MAADIQALPYDPTAFLGLRVFDLWEGWESIENYLIVKGHISVGTGVERRLPNSKRSRGVIAELTKCAGTWRRFRLPKPVKNGLDPFGVAKFVHPLDWRLGFSSELVALADSICGAGGWRTGRILSASPEPILAKIRRGEPLALLAAAGYDTPAALGIPV